MSALWIDGFDGYRATTGVVASNEVDDFYAPFSYMSVTAGGGKFGGFCATGTMDKALSYSGNAVRLGFWNQCNNTSSTTVSFSTQIQRNPTGSNTVAGTYVRIYSDGVYLYDGTASTVRATYNRTVTPGTWEWFEIEIRETGIKLMRGGVTVAQYDGTVALPSVLRVATGSSNVIDDMVIWDNSGASLNNFPIGPQRIQLLETSGAGDSAQFTPAAATNWEGVKAATWAGGAGNSTATTAQKDLFNMGDMDASLDPSTINCLAVKAMANDTGTGGSALKLKVKQSATEADSPAISLFAPNLRLLQSYFYKAPDNSDWTRTKINAAQAGYESVI